MSRCLSCVRRRDGGARPRGGEASLRSSAGSAGSEAGLCSTSAMMDPIGRTESKGYFQWPVWPRAGPRRGRREGVGDVEDFGRVGRGRIRIIDSEHLGWRRCERLGGGALDAQSSAPAAPARAQLEPKYPRATMTPSASHGDLVMPIDGACGFFDIGDSGWSADDMRRRRRNGARATNESDESNAMSRGQTGRS